MVWIRCVRSDTFRRDFVARTFALIAPEWPICTKFSAVTKRSQMHPNITKNETKHEFKAPWCVSGEFLAKSSDATSWHELLHQLHQYGPFCTKFSAVAKWSQVHPNITKHTKTCVLGPIVWIGRIHSDKFRCDFVSRTYALIAPDWPICTEFSVATKRS